MNWYILNGHQQAQIGTYDMHRCITRTPLKISRNENTFSFNATHFDDNENVLRQKLVFNFLSYSVFHFDPK